MDGVIKREALLLCPWVLLLTWSPVRVLGSAHSISCARGRRVGQVTSVRGGGRL